MEVIQRTPVLIPRIDDIDVRLQLDTGSGSTVTLYPEIIDKIRAVPTGATRQSIGIEGVPMDNPVYVVARVGLGKAVYEDLEIRRDGHTAKHRDETIKYRGTYGHIGLGLFQGDKIIIDYPHRKFTIIPPDAPNEDQLLCDGIELPLDSEKLSLGLVTPTQTDIGELNVVWDTGARGNIMVKHTTDAAGLDLRARDKFETKVFAINGHDFGPVRMNVWDIPAFPTELHALVGYWFFADKIVCVDLPRDSIYVRFSTAN